MQASFQAQKAFEFAVPAVPPSFFQKKAAKEQQVAGVAQTAFSERAPMAVPIYAPLPQQLPQRPQFPSWDPTPFQLPKVPVAMRGLGERERKEELEREDVDGVPFHPAPMSEAAISATYDERYITEEEAGVLKRYVIGGERSFVKIGKRQLIETGLSKAMIVKVMRVSKEMFRRFQSEVQTNGKIFQIDGKDFLIKCQNRQLHIYLLSGKKQLGPGGGSGIAYKILNVTSGIFEALKLAHNKKIARESIQQEIVMLKKVNSHGSHPGIQHPPTVEFDIHNIDGSSLFGFVGPLYQGDLNDWIKKNHNLQTRINCCRILIEAACELWEMRKIQHLDLKPENIFVEQINGYTTFRFADFGSAVEHGKVQDGFWTGGYYQGDERDRLSRLAERLQSRRTGSALSSGDGLKLEQFTSRAASLDMFALGTIFFQILAGDTNVYPYRKKEDAEDSMDIIDEAAPFDPTPLRKVGVPGEIEVLISQMVNHDHKARIDLVTCLNTWRKLIPC